MFVFLTRSQDGNHVRMEGGREARGKPRSSGRQIGSQGRQIGSQGRQEGRPGRRQRQEIHLFKKAIYLKAHLFKKAIYLKIEGTLRTVPKCT